jgi:hypothetical protein
MQIVFSNGETVDLILNQTPVALIYQKIYKHLQHVPVPFRDWDSPFYFYNHSLQQIVNKLVMYAEKVNVPIDQQRCLAQDQNYLNSIHKIYEKNYNGDPAWLDFHEHIHLCEEEHPRRLKNLQIDYREKSGLLERPFDYNWLEHATTKIKAGDVFVRWSELGKTPYSYWDNDEPDDMLRMQELIKPWIKLKPIIFVALEDKDLQKNPKEFAEFESWWAQYSEELCKYWNIPLWALNNMSKFLVLGKVVDIDTIITPLKNNAKPIRVIL